MFQSLYNSLSLSWNRPQRSETAMAFFQLSRMLSAGVSLSDALDDLAADGAARHQPSWRMIATRVSEGQGLSEAFACNTGLADKTIIALIKAGEAGGQLATVCYAVYEYLQWHHELRQRLLTLLIYPLFSLCVLVGVTGFMFVSVVPSIQGFLLSSGSPLQWHTLALIDLSSWMNRYYLPALVICLTGVSVMLCIVLLSVRVRLLCHACVLKLPLIGRMATDMALSRYASCCAQLYGNGVPLESSMALAEETVMNQAIRRQLSGVRCSMVAGTTLGNAMAQVSILPSLFIRLVAVGERAGQLAEVLTQIGEHQSAAAQASIKRMEQLIGPVMLMFIGTILLWIVVSVLAPVYDMAIATVVSAS